MQKLVLPILLAGLLIQPDPALSKNDIPLQNLLVSANWLHKRLGDNTLVIVDTRDPVNYEESHIENAVNIPVTATFSQETKNDLVAPLSVIQTLLSAAGIDNQSQIILYDQQESINAARVFWVLEVYGHQHVAILNGGFEKWQALDFPVNQALPKIEPKQFIPSIVPDRLSTKFSTRLAIADQSKILLDARSETEYRGDINKFQRAGHIPSAVNVPSDRNLQVTKDGHTEIKPIIQLERIYQGLDKNKKIITYCNKGKESALTYFVLRQLGYTVSAYDGSWFEWNTDLNLPIEQTPHSRD